MHRFIADDSNGVQRLLNRCRETAFYEFRYVAIEVLAVTAKMATQLLNT